MFSGGTPSKGNADYWRGPIPWVSAKDLKADRIFDAELHISQQACEESAAKMAPIGSLLMLVRGMGLANGIQIGEVTSPVAFNQDLRAIVPPSTVDSRFLLLALRYRLGDGGKSVLSSAAHGTLKIDADALRRVEFPVPPLQEQQRLVAILDGAFEASAKAKANAKKNLQNAQELFVSRREALLSSVDHGWAEAPLHELCDIKHGYAFEGEFFTPEGDYVLLTPGNYFESGGYRDRGEKQKFFTGPIPSDYILAKDSLLVAMTEQAAGLLGSPLLVPEPDRYLHNQRLGLVVGKPGAAWVNEFFFHVFNLTRVRAEIHASASGVKVRHTSPSKIGAVRVAFPTTLADQRKVASKLYELASECDQLSSIFARKLAAIDELKRSLLHQAFTGGLSQSNDRTPQARSLQMCTQ